MKDTMKKSLGILLATLGMCTAFAGCGTTPYKGDVLDGFDATAEVKSNGGFAVEQGDYVYFINGKDTHEKDNTYGNVVKSALMRVDKAGLVNGDYSSVKTVVPSLFVADDYNAGIYIYGEYVYYATPTTYTTMEGNVGNTQIDFKRAKLDGSEAPMKDCFFRLSNKASKYRFVQVDDVVYCLYEEDNTLKSFNTSTRKTTVLVSGAEENKFYYDLEKADSPYVYYTMKVKASLNSQEAGYNQLYCVRADATVTAINAENASYTISDGYTYDFDEEEMKEANKNGSSYVFNDYTTYPFVNLGTLVLDGVGKSTTKTIYTRDDMAGCIEMAGYKYIVNSYRNGGLYFKREAVQGTGSSNENDKLYYVADATVAQTDWDTITGNADDKLETVATSTTKTGSALFDAVGDIQYYFYVENELLYRAGYDNENKVSIAPMALTKKKIGSVELWKLDRENKDLYFHKATDGGNGKTLSKIRYDGGYYDDEDYYNGILGEVEYQEYQPVSYTYVDFNNPADWYMPELIAGQLLYANVQSFGDVSYNYVYATKLGSVAEVKANNAKYEAIQNHIKDTAHSTTVQNVMQYYFRTGKTDLYNAVIDKYSASQKKTIATFIENCGDGKEYANSLQSNFINVLGKVTEDDAKAMEESFKKSLLQADANTNASGVEPWVVWTIVGVGSALIIAGVVVALCIVSAKKKAKKAEEEATVNAYKRKIDTTDDKSIDVYADDAELKEEKSQDETDK